MGDARVFIVTSGEYSDYQIESVWTTREDAEREAGKWERVEEYVLNERVPTPVIQWYASYNKTQGEIRVGDNPGLVQEVGHTFAEYRDGELCGWGYGPSPEHARKSLADALAKARAEHEGL